VSTLSLFCYDEDRQKFTPFSIKLNKINSTDLKLEKEKKAKGYIKEGWD